MSQGRASELAQAEAMPGYNAPDAYLDPEVTAAIAAWLSAHAEAATRHAGTGTTHPRRSADGVRRLPEGRLPRRIGARAVPKGQPRPA